MIDSVYTHDWRLDMTLKEWETKTGEYTSYQQNSTYYGVTARFIHYGVNPNRKELWHLSDWRVWRVTSVSGGTIWLMPR